MNIIELHVYIFAIKKIISSLCIISSKISHQNRKYILIIHNKNINSVHNEYKQTIWLLVQTNFFSFLWYNKKKSINDRSISLYNFESNFNR